MHIVITAFTTSNPGSACGTISQSNTHRAKRTQGTHVTLSTDWKRQDAVISARLASAQRFVQSTFASIVAGHAAGDGPHGAPHEANFI